MQAEPSGPPDLCVIIPAKNEAANLRSLLPDLQRTLRELGCKSEIIVADAGSDDDTSRIAGEFGARLMIQKDPGYGGALREAFQCTRARFITTMDADHSHHPTLLHHFWASRDTTDILIASRFVQGGRATMPWLRLVLSRILNAVYSKVLSLPFHDMSSGFRFYRREVLETLGPLRSVHFEILQEILIKAYCQGRRIDEIPFHYQVRQEGSSKARILRFGIAHLQSLRRMWALRHTPLSCDYDSRAFNSRIPLQRYWHRARYRLIHALLDSHASVLDIGCGSGRLIQSLPAAVGLDLDVRRLRFVQSANRRLVGGDLSALPLKSAVFDTIVCSNVVEHIPRDPAVFSELTRPLRPGGHLILGTPDYDSAMWKTLAWIKNLLFPRGYEHQHAARYTRAEIRQALQETGLRIVEERSILGAEVIFRAVKEASPPPAWFPRDRHREVILGFVGFGIIAVL